LAIEVGRRGAARRAVFAIDHSESSRAPPGQFTFLYELAGYVNC
jgi:hypothetical protein